VNDLLTKPSCLLGKPLQHLKGHGPKIEVDYGSVGSLRYVKQFTNANEYTCRNLTTQDVTTLGHVTHDTSPPRFESIYHSTMKFIMHDLCNNTLPEPRFPAPANLQIPQILVSW
jgi:hypothetical protein